MRRFTLPLVIVGSIALAALLTWIAMSSSHLGGRAPRAEPPGSGGESVSTKLLRPFSKLDVAGIADVTLVQGTTESVTIVTTLRKTIPVSFEVEGDTLYIRSRDRTNWWEGILGSELRTPQVVVNFKDLSSIAAAGTVKLTAASMKGPALQIAGAGGTQIQIEDLQTDALRLSGAGALKAELAGRATEQSVTISGAGDYRGARLASQNATVTVAGAGRVVVSAEQTLKATISGAGMVEYLGNPRVTQRVSGAGSVRRRDA